jgi:NitT/TauT family transport system substrate-binding protein
MVYNEYHTVLESGVGPEDLNIIDYGDYGLAFPGDVLFTSLETARERPELCAAMLRASLRGWKYAVEHPEEAVEIVLKYDPDGTQTREHQRSMMAEITKLVQESVRPVGYTDRTDVRRTIETLFSYGSLSDPVQPEDVFTNEFWIQARTAIE